MTIVTAVLFALAQGDSPAPPLEPRVAAYALQLRDDASFWEALDEVCRKAAIWYYPATDPLYLNGGMASIKPRAYYGPVMIVMDRLIQQRKVTFDKVESDYLIRLMCVWERHVSPLG